MVQIQYIDPDVCDRVAHGHCQDPHGARARHTPDEIPALVEAGMKDPLNFVSVTPEELRGRLEYLFSK